MAPQLHGPAGLGASAPQLCGFRDCVQGLLKYVLESVLESLLESLLESVLESLLKSILESGLEFLRNLITHKGKQPQTGNLSHPHPPATKEKTLGKAIC